MPESRKLRVFLCHAKEDKPTVRTLYNFLCQNGIDAWFDEEKLLPGQDWRVEIPKAIKDSDAILVCLSKNAITKEGYVQKEIKYALDKADEKPGDTIFMIPARLEECNVPDRLSRWQWVDLFQSSGFQKLLEGLRSKVSTINMQVQQLTPFSSAFGLVNDIWAGIQFVKIYQGKFIMGSDMGKEHEEKPSHTLEIPYDYLIAKFPITNLQFADFVKATSYISHAQQMGMGYVWHGYQWIQVPGANWANPLGPLSNISDKRDHPVVLVSWSDAQWYCDWLNKQFRGQLGDRLTFRLPTEAEWEKAARGDRGNLWPWGNTFDPTRCNSSEKGPNRTTPVGAYSPLGDSVYGAVDMAGNIKEWTLSLWGESANVPTYKYPYNRKDGRESLLAGKEILRVVRGGSFGQEGLLVRSTMRFRSLPYICANDMGFRIVLAPFIT